MIVYEFKVKAKAAQYRAIDQGKSTSQFVQNKYWRYGMDNQGVGRYDLNKYCAVLGAVLGAVLVSQLDFADKLNSKVTIAIPVHNRSQNCSDCGKKVKKLLSTRTHVCRHCGFVKDRDVNPAINIRKLALSTVGIRLLTLGESCQMQAIGAILSSNGESLKQEFSHF